VRKLGTVEEPIVNHHVPTTTIKSMNGDIVEWAEVEKLAVAGVPLIDLSRKFNIKAATVRKRAQRFHWTTPVAIARRALQIQSVKNELAVNQAATDWVAKGEAHRKKAFEIASESVKAFRPKAPRNFRELESADKIARRAAGLDVSEVQVQTLIQMNENIDNFDQPEEITDAEIIEVIPDSAPVAALPA
jgi:hypothetical protein